MAAPAAKPAQATPPAHRPAFARDFPSDPALDRILALFDQGNYAQVRKEVQALPKSVSAEVRAAAQEIAKRLEPDPLALYLVAIAAALLAVLAGWYWTHPHEEAPPPPLVPTAPEVPAKP
jgi:hypothetical protein